ncbi:MULTISPECIES: copper homeostasis membrane protein CopD [Nitrobacteraceae]|jgi:putative copper resistance protein D|uniref:Copper resistance protein CopD n=1 Tax=Rhodopseudomonas palustris TaxID=1076 RepID=A0A0D7EZB5_RHOPL|nr:MULTISPECIES: copper homeostasis membrane protein CopD [Nitrobacteraceae]MBY0381009.1 copper homeostasis membrane protein CopD [Xanthobacteraceae bacterium]KIZ44787.1 copper resistance protein CopD [Rhodopseudomonas palustris]KQW18036.1 copper resistance protein CopD [Afipia sp. Root123D2]MDF3811352.1 copper homeostasis membrane protein CopD [Rhodopseudomonas sp. BAL398]WOK20937.1 copper homeostasis membrane protein CopD [Rhodopseudomonas sp. BAL398]
MIEAGLIIARFLHYLATTALAGLSLFPLYAYAGAEPGVLGRWRQRWILWIAVAALFSGLCWFAFAAANMSGSMADLLDAETLWAVVHDTGFGTVWTLRMLLATLMVGVAARGLRSKGTAYHQNWMMPLLAAILLASLAGTGHAQIEEGWAGVMHIVADAVHLLAAGVWLGGLIPLALILHRYLGTDLNVGPKDMDRILMRFSGMGYLAVAALIGSGFVNSWFLVGSLSGLLNTPYGQILLGKLALFGGMLALAIANRFWLVPSMGRIRKDAAEGLTRSSARLRNHVLGEQFLGWMVLLAVSILGTMQPAAG